MRDLFPEDWKPKLKRAMLAIDAWVDFSVFRSAAGSRETYERFSTFMDRFHTAGWRRWAVEVTSEGATLGCAGGVLLLALATPAFQMTADDDWLKKSELAVTFLDRYGNEVGSRGIRHNDSIPLDQFPDNLIKVTGSPGSRRTSVEGLDDLLAQCYEQWKLPSELKTPWAKPGREIAIAEELCP